MKKSLGIFLLLLYIQVHCFAQDSIGISYAKRITSESFRLFVDVLTSDSLEGRETGRRGQKKAAAFIENHFRSLPLNPPSHGGFLQYTSLSARANGSRNFKANEKNFVFMRDYFYPQGSIDTTYVFKKIHFAGYGISTEKYDDYKKIKLDGGVVLFFDGIPKTKKLNATIVESAGKNGCGQRRKDDIGNHRLA
jgi:hypothetical protein